MNTIPLITALLMVILPAPQAEKTEPPPDTSPLVQEAIIPATPEEVWQVISTKEGWEAWTVAHAEVDFRIGGAIRTHYDPKGTIGDPQTIENTVIAYEEPRMMAFRCTKAPEDFPFRAEIAKTWSIIYLESAGPQTTRLRCVGLGYDATANSQKMRRFFEKGNSYTFDKLRELFEKRGHAAVGADDEAILRTLRRLIGGDWIHESKNPAGKLFRVRNVLEPGPGETITSLGWLGDADGMFYHGHTQIWRRSAAEGGGIWFSNLSEKGIRAEGPITRHGENGVVWHWPLGTRSKSVTMRIEMTLAGADVYHFKMFPPGGAPAPDLEFRRVREAPAEFTRLKSQKREPAAAAEPVGDGAYAACIAAAEKSLRLNETTESLRWLEAAPAESRGWEWSHLLARTDDSVAEFAAHTGGASTLAASRDGMRLVSGGADGLIKVWDVASGAELARTTEKQGPVWSVALSPDGRRIVSAQDRVTRLWDAKSGALLHTFTGHQTPASAAVFTPDGSRVVCSSYEMGDPKNPRTIDGTVYVWKATDKLGELVATLRGGGVKPLSCLAVTPDGGQVVAGSWDGAIFVWSLAEPGNPTRLDVPDEGVYHAVDCVDVSPDGKWIASGGKDRAVRIWDRSAAKLVASLREPTGPVQGVRFSPDGKLLAAAASDHLVRVWNVEDRKLLATFRGHRGMTRGLAWSPDAAVLFSSSGDGTVRQWRLAAPRDGTLSFRGGEGCYASLFLPGGDEIVSCFYNGSVVVWDGRDGAEKRRWQAHAGASCNSVTASADGARLATASWDKSVRVWESATGRELARFDEPKGVYYAAISADGARVAAAVGAEIHLWDVGEKKRIGELKGHTAPVHCLAFSADGSRLVSGSADQSARVWRIGDGACIATARGHAGAVHGVAFAADGASIVTGSHDGDVLRFDATTGARLRVLHAGDDPIQRVALSPDGTRVAATAGRLLLIDAAHGGLLVALEPHEGNLWEADFSADGRRLASCSTNGTIAVCETEMTRTRGSATERTARR